MKKKTKIFLTILVIILLLPFLGWLGLKGYVKYVQYQYVQEIKEPYLTDARESLGGDTPMGAYQGFREALENDNQEKALQFLFKDSRDEYQDKLKDLEIKKNILDMPAELKKESESKCTGEAIVCQKKSSYSYQYEVKENKKVEVLGEEVEVKKGKKTGQVIFIKNLEGKWQIYQI